jgi:hypothetical protein
MNGGEPSSDDTSHRTQSSRSRLYYVVLYVIGLIPYRIDTT